MRHWRANFGSGHSGTCDPSGRPTCNRQPSRTPLRKSVLKPPNPEPSRAKRSYSFIGQHTVRAATVSDNFVIGIEFRQPSPKGFERNVDGIRHMPERVFVLRAHVQHRYHSRVQTLPQLLARDWLQTVAIMKIAAHDLLHFSYVALRDAAKRGQQIEHRVIGKAVVDEFTVAPRRYETGAPQMLEML